MKTEDIALLEKWRAKLKKEIQTANDPNFKMDLNVLLESVVNDLEGKHLGVAMHIKDAITCALKQIEN